MTRSTSSALVLSALPLLVVLGCGSSDNHKTATTDSPSTANCDHGDNKVGDDCSCADDTTSSYLCSDNTLTCDCPDDAPVTTHDAGKKPVSTRDAGSSLQADAKAPPSSSPDAAGNPDPGNGGIPGDGGIPGNGGMMTPVTTSGSEPVIPKASGTCPDFKTATMTIGGLAGIQVQAGSKSSGTAPLVFYWHGTGSSAAEVNYMLPAAARKEILDQGGLIVSFEGSTKKGADCSGTGIFSQGDFEIADLIASCAVDHYGINPRRIYTTGCSAGGLQSGCMAAQRSSYIAAAVPNSGGLVVQQAIQDPKHTPAIMTMHGGASDMVFVTFSQTSATLDAAMKKAGSFVMNCNHGGGHCAAPAALQQSGWQFMKDHPFGVTPEPYAGGIPTSFPKYCMAY